MPAKIPERWGKRRSHIASARAAGIGPQPGAPGIPSEREFLREFFYFSGDREKCRRATTTEYRIIAVPGQSSVCGRDASSYVCACRRIPCNAMLQRGRRNVEFVPRKSRSGCIGVALRCPSDGRNMDKTMSQTGCFQVRIVTPFAQAAANFTTTTIPQPTLCANKHRSRLGEKFR